MVSVSRIFFFFLRKHFFFSSFYDTSRFIVHKILQLLARKKSFDTFLSLSFFFFPVNAETLQLLSLVGLYSCIVEAVNHRDFNSKCYHMQPPSRRTKLSRVINYAPPSPCFVSPSDCFLSSTN